jgi:hypothetical protein
VFIPRLLALLLISSGAALAVEPGVFQRGDYRFTIAPAPDWVEPHAPAAEWDAAAPGATGTEWRNWLIDSQVDVRHGERTRYYDYVFEPRTAEQLTDAGKFNMQFNPDFEQLALHAVSVFRGGAWQDRLDPEQVTLARREAAFESDVATGVVMRWC